MKEFEIGILDCLPEPRQRFDLQSRRLNRVFAIQPTVPGANSKEPIDRFDNLYQFKQR
jgi:hypothetical protein